jgi:hypothetical protein
MYYIGILKIFFYVLQHKKSRDLTGLNYSNDFLAVSLFGNDLARSIFVRPCNEVIIVLWPTWANLANRDNENSLRDAAAVSDLMQYVFICLHNDTKIYNNIDMYNYTLKINVSRHRTAKYAKQAQRMIFVIFVFISLKCYSDNQFFLVWFVVIHPRYF